jgi:cyanate permease
VVLFFWGIWELVARACIIYLKSRQARRATDVPLCLMFLSVLVVNGLDAGFLYAPNVALLWWFLVFSFAQLVLFPQTDVRGSADSSQEANLHV